MELQQGCVINGMGQRDPFAAQQFLTGHVRYGSKADIGARQRNVRFAPNSGHRNSVSKCPLCAKSGHMQCSKQYRYSITWLASARNESGMVIPIALAVVRLTRSSNFVGCSTGISVGLVPCNILSTSSA